MPFYWFCHEAAPLIYVLCDYYFDYGSCLHSVTLNLSVCYLIMFVSARTHLLWILNSSQFVVKSSYVKLLVHILIPTVPRRYFCCGSLLLLVLVVRIYTLVHLLCE